MVIRAIGYNKLIGLESGLKYLTNTSFQFYNLGDLHRRLNTQPIHLITKKLKESGLVETTNFTMAVDHPELVKKCIKSYNMETKHILFPN